MNDAVSSVVERVREAVQRDKHQWWGIVLDIGDVEALLVLADTVDAEARIEYGPRTLAALRAVTEASDGD